MKIASKSTLKEAEQHLSANDPVFKALIKKYGSCVIKPHTNYYQELVESIISQQLSVKAAASILEKFKKLFESSFPTPEEILGTDIDKLRTAGLSRQKALYIQDLASKIIQNDIDLSMLNTLSNKEVVEELTKVKGIGEWTAHMFLIFAMGRLNVLAHGDLGIRNAMKALYSFTSLPAPENIKHIAEQNHWSPYETVACWYLWRSLENKP